MIGRSGKEAEGDLEADPRFSLEVVLCGVLLVATMVIHGAGMYCVVSAARYMLAQNQPSRRSVHIGMVTPILVIVTLTTHLVDITFWALAFETMGLVSPVRHAIHFAALTYTTLGAPFSLPEQWLLLEAACAVAGTLTFAWTTAVMFQILNRVFDLQSG